MYHWGKGSGSSTCFVIFSWIVMVNMIRIVLINRIRIVMINMILIVMLNMIRIHSLC